jgi:hypothetical protein
MRIALPGITWRPLLRSLVSVAPFVLLSLILNQPVWLKAALVAISAQIAWERTGLAPLGVLLHGFAIAAGFLALFSALLVPPIFVVACALMAAGTIRLAAEGSKFRSLGNFTFIPALYLACETAENLPHDLYWPTALAFLPYIALALIPVIIQAAIEHLREETHPRGLRHFTRLAKNQSFGEHGPYLEDMAAVILAVGTAAFLVEWRGLDQGQWVIWSAASVVTGDMASSRLKLRDRALGACVGVPIGIAAGLAVPHSAIAYGLATLGIFLTLVAFRRYVIGFGTRCALIALALLHAGRSVEIASERVLNVILGGVIGVLFVFAAHMAAQHLKLPSRK